MLITHVNIKIYTDTTEILFMNLVPIFYHKTIIFHQKLARREVAEIMKQRNAVVIWLIIKK